jgi:hypothetical protein
MNRRDALKSGIGSLIAGSLVLAQEEASAQGEVTNDATHWTDGSDVIWTTPSKDASGSLPMGNGEVGINLWVEAGGDLFFTISRSDTFSEVARLLKVGRVRVSFTPNPFAAGQPFRQHLQLRDGVCEITAGESGKRVVLTVFVDAEQPVVHCVGTSNSPIRVTAQVVSWREERHTLAAGDERNSAWTMEGAPFPLTEAADGFPPHTKDAVSWYHRNETSPAFTETLRVQSLSSAADTIPDPILHRTFGGWLTGSDFTATDDRTLSTADPVKAFALRVAAPCLQTASAKEWSDAAEKVAAASSAPPAIKRTLSWWRAYWKRSWVVVGRDGKQGEMIITRGYTLQRYMQACGGRGAYPIKFNGGIFTVEPKAEGKSLNPDWRRWGDPHWYQNLRHMYHPMPASGDTEMMEPFFRLYERVRPLAEARTRLYHKAEGCYFPETMTVWGTYANSDYGWDRKGKQPKDVVSPWWRYAWNQGPELLALFLDRWDYTEDEPFLKDRVLPMAVSVLTYFDTRFARDAEGRVILDPAQSIETFWTGVVNDLPTVAGLKEITARLCALPDKLTTAEQRTFFTRMQAAVPVLPLEEIEVDGAKRTTIAPAQKYDRKRSNVENPELYAVWPFRLYGLGRPDLAVARTAYARRVNHLDVGWGYDGNCAALLGLTDEAARILRVKCANSNPAYRWPATWGPNFDWLPDQNHGGNLLETTQLMLLQSVGRQIFLLPAWPKDWDVHFRLHAPHKTVVECVYRSGRMEKLSVSPRSRQKDLVLPDFLIS